MSVTSAQMPDIAAERTDLSAEDIHYLQLLLSDWTLIADLSFADLLLWLPTCNDGGFVAAAQIRPATSRTHIPDDLVGHVVPRGRHFELDQALATELMCDGAPTAAHSVTQAVPIRREGKVIAILGRYASKPSDGQLETAYGECADSLVAMVSSGQFPRETQSDQGTGGRGGAPRVGDGLIILDVSGTIRFASPNARSAFRRLGVSVDIEGNVLADLVSKMNKQGIPINDTLSLVIRGAIQGTSEINGSSSSATIRSIPLIHEGHERRTMILMRDVSDLRRREQALLGKDAAIREIHHRVKNNLQTVASLLRLQGRRLDDSVSRTAIAEAVRRVQTIAVVHDLLAHNPGADVDFDDVAARVISLTVETSLAPSIYPHVTGEFGTLPSDKASTLALVLAELVSNAIEHAEVPVAQLRVEVSVTRELDRVHVQVADNGVGIELPIDVSRGLGLAIVTNLVQGELRGTIEFSHVDPPATHKGTMVVINMPV